MPSTLSFLLAMPQFSNPSPQLLGISTYMPLRNQTIPSSTAFCICHNELFAASQKAQNVCHRRVVLVADMDSGNLNGDASAEIPVEARTMKQRRRASTVGRRILPASRLYQASFLGVYAQMVLCCASHPALSAKRCRAQTCVS